jgi:TonB family protein
VSPRFILAALFSFTVAALPPAASAAKLHTFYGDVKAVDLAAKTITIKSSGKSFVFHVTNETKMTSRRGPIRLENVQRGQGAAVVMRLGQGGVGIAVNIHFDLGPSAASMQSLYGVKTTGGEIITGMAFNNYIVSRPPDEAWSTGITYEKLRASMFVLTIQRDGTVADAKAVQGTGYRELDERAVRWFKKWRFRPNSVVEARMPYGYFQRRR